MKLFIYSILFLTTINFVFSQTKETVLQKSFEATENTVLNVDVDNVSILFEESFDGKIHFDYSIVFGDYSRKKREMIFNKVKANVSKKNNLITLDVKNGMDLGEIYKLDVSKDFLLISMKEYIKSEKNRNFQYKTTDSLKSEIRNSNGLNFNDFIKKNNYQNKNPLKNRKVFIQQFTIKVPKNVTIKLGALYSNITFNYNIDKPIVVNAFQGHFKFKNLESKDNTFNLISGVFQAEKINGGNFNFKDISKVVLGTVSNSNFISETSKIEIGDIAENVTFKDFNSKLYFYNFDKRNFKFDFKGDYSDVSFYNVKKSSYFMNINGYNTSLNMDEMKTIFGNSNDKKLTKILEKKVKLNEIKSGDIELELTNGICNIK